MLHAAAGSGQLQVSQNASGRFFPFFAYAAFTLLVFLSADNPFFWDNVLVSSGYANWYYQTNFSTLFLPSEIDAGYQPLFGMLLAFTWKIFGRNLWSSHLMMLPFVLGIVHQLLVLTRKFIPSKFLPFALILLLSDPTLLAQCTQVSPDVVLVFLYLFCLNNMLKNQRIWLAIGLVFLGLISLRGTISVAALFFTDVWLLYFSAGSFSYIRFRNIVLSFLPTVIMACGWLWLHYLHTGWFGYNPDPNWNWSTGAQFAGLSGMFRNGIVIAWRLLDFGRVAVWLVAGFAAYKLLKEKRFFTPEVKQLAGLFLLPLVIYSIISLPYTNTIGHRYYLVVYLLFGLFTFYLLAQLKPSVFSGIAYCLMVLSLLSGNFWVYPDHIAKGWDSSLAHLPYFKLKAEMIDYLTKQQIPISETGSAFPNLYPQDISDLNNDQRQFKAKDLQTDRFILYSNVFNDFTDEELTELKTRWKPVKELKKGQVKFILYQRPQKP